MVIANVQMVVSRYTFKTETSLISHMFMLLTMYLLPTNLLVVLT